MTPDEILREAERWNVDISPSPARILNFASWVRAMALEEAAKACDAEAEWSRENEFHPQAHKARICAGVIRALKDQPC